VADAIALDTPDAAAAPAKRVVSVWNPANAVTASRYLTLPPLYWAIAHGYRQWATIVIVICALLDKADGLVAKLFDCKSAFGELFDAITDAACYGFALIVVAAYGWAPAIPVAAVIILGLTNTVMRAIYVKRAGRTTNYKSYAMERIVGYTSYLVGFATSNMEVTLFYWAFVPLMTVILIHDTKRMLVDPIAPERAPAIGAHA
jgi:phosphatidylglycerophosphate synthase